MEARALASKYRPTNLSAVVGQDQVLAPIRHSLAKGSIHHAFLFSGTRGVGKTSVARILVKCLNCQKGPTESPCGSCAVCVACDQNALLDFIEIDAASHSKVEDMRDLLDSILYPPVQGRMKIILLDEVHMLSTHSFNALLKTLEEPPEYLFFILATTELEKIPATIRSRCLLFHFHPAQNDVLVSSLAAILDAEKIAYAPAALAGIADAAQGSIRDAITILESAIGASDDTLTIDSVQSVLGPSAVKIITTFFNALVHHDLDRLQESIALLHQYPGEALKIVDDLISSLQAATLQAIIPPDDNHVDTPAASLPPAFLQVFLQIAIETRKNFHYYPSARAAVTNLMLRIQLMNQRLQGETAPNTSRSAPAPTSPSAQHPIIAEAKKLANLELVEHHKRV